MDRDQYEEDLERRQQEHLRRVRNNPINWRPCMHDGCSQCHGTGIKTDGSSCIHMISCPCPKCSPTCMASGMTKQGERGSRNAIQDQKAQA